MTHAEPVRDLGRLWPRVREGLATAVLGRLPDPPAELQLLRVNCEVAPAALRPLLEARRLVEAIVGEAKRRPDRAHPGRRRTLFGDTPERPTEAVVVDLWNQLARQPGARWVMVFDAVEQADEATLAALTQILRRPAEWMRLPLVLAFHCEPKGAAAELLAAVQARGADAVIRGDEAPGSEAPTIAWTSLPPEALRVLRAGALIGPGFEARIVAELLDLDPVAVLERLQQATDLGVPLEDRGQGRFSLPTAALSALSASLLPSLAQAWHRRLGRLLGARAAEQARKPPPPPDRRAKRAQIESPGEALVTEILDLSEDVVDLVMDGEEPAGDTKMSEGTVSAMSAEATPAEGAAGGDAKAVASGTAAQAAAGGEVATSDMSEGTGSEATASGEASAGAAEQAAAGGEAATSDMSSGTDAEAEERSASDVSAGTDGGAASAGSAGTSEQGTATARPDSGAQAVRRRKTEIAPSVWAHAPPVEPSAAPSGQQVRPLASRRRTQVFAGRAAALQPAEPPAPEAPVRAAPEPAAPASAAPEPVAPASAAPVRPEEQLIDEVRAAEHMRLAGEYEAAARHLCAAARKAADMGASQAAAQHAGNALSLLATLPPSAPRRALKVQALIELGRLQWLAAGYDFGFTLAQALATLESARAELDPDAPVDLAAELGQTIAGVCFDLGDPASLERALTELVAACKALEAAGDTLGANCLLNDQAAVLVRMGDPVRALQLLRASRQVFASPAPDDPIALREFAENEHLFARLPLHAQLRPGREEEGYAMGLDHALAAERAYRELGEARELARVWETMGRLELRRGRLEEAARRLEAAREAQTQLGDLAGLAHTSEALAEVRAQAGDAAEALTLLRDAVIHSRDKGTPLGLILIRRTFDAFAGRLAQQPEHAAGLQEVSILLSAGERELGLSQPAAVTAPA